MPEPFRVPPVGGDLGGLLLDLFLQVLIGQGDQRVSDTNPVPFGGKEVREPSGPAGRHDRCVCGQTPLEGRSPVVIDPAGESDSGCQGDSNDENDSAA